MAPKSSLVTADTLRIDLSNVIPLLKAIEAVVPGHVPDELLAKLEATLGNDLALDLLAGALNRPTK